MSDNTSNNIKSTVNNNDERKLTNAFMLDDIFFFSYAPEEPLSAPEEEESKKDFGDFVKSVLATYNNKPQAPQQPLPQQQQQQTPVQLAQAEISQHGKYINHVARRREEEGEDYKEKEMNNLTIEQICSSSLFAKSSVVIKLGGCQDIIGTISWSLLPRDIKVDAKCDDNKADQVDKEQQQEYIIKLVSMKDSFLHQLKPFLLEATIINTGTNSNEYYINHSDLVKFLTQALTLCPRFDICIDFAKYLPEFEIVLDALESKVKKNGCKFDCLSGDRLIHWQSLSGLYIDMLSSDDVKSKEFYDRGIVFNFPGGFGDNQNRWAVGFKANEPTPFAEWCQGHAPNDDPNEVVYYHGGSSDQLLSKVFKESLKYAKTLRLGVLGLGDSPRHYRKMIRLCQEYAARKGLHFQIREPTILGLQINSWTNAELLKELGK